MSVYVTQYTICSLVLHGKSQCKVSPRDGMSHTALRHWWCIVVLNVHVPSQDIYDDSQESFCEELQQLFDQFPKHHIKILLWEFSATLRRLYKCGRWGHCAVSECRQMNVKWQSIKCHKLIPQDTCTFTLTTGNENLQENRNDNGDIVVNVAISKNLTVKSIMLPYLNPDQCTWTSTDGGHSQSDQTCLDERKRYLYLMSIFSEELPVIMITICWLHMTRKQCQ